MCVLYIIRHRTHLTEIASRPNQAIFYITSLVMAGVALSMLQLTTLTTGFTKKTVTYCTRLNLTLLSAAHVVQYNAVVQLNQKSGVDPGYHV